MIESKTGKVQESRDISAGDKTVVLSFEADNISIAEPRVFYPGKGELEFERIEIRLKTPG